MEGSNSRQYFCMLGYSNMPEGCGFEQICYHSDFSRFHKEASEFMWDQLDGFCSAYGESFNLAEYPDPEDMLDEQEQRILAERLEADGEVMDALVPVLKQRLSVQSFDALKQAEKLFNYTIEHGVDKHNICFCREDVASTWIFIEKVEKFGPFFIDRVLQQISIHDAKGLYGHSVMGGLMSPFRSIVEGMKRAVEHDSWPANELSLGRFFMLMDIYEELAESQY